MPRQGTPFTTGNNEPLRVSMDNKVAVRKPDNLDQERVRSKDNYFTDGIDDERPPCTCTVTYFRVINDKGNLPAIKSFGYRCPMRPTTIEFLGKCGRELVFSLPQFHFNLWWREWTVFFSYEEQASIQYLPIRNGPTKKLQKESNEFHFMAENDFATNGKDGMANCWQNALLEFWGDGMAFRVSLNGHVCTKVETPYR